MYENSFTVRKTPLAVIKINLKNQYLDPYLVELAKNSFENQYY